MVEKYIIGDPADGWMQVKLEPSQTRVPLPQYIKVKFSARRNNRDYFRILEGSYKDQDASVAARSATTSWLGSPLPVYRGAASLTFNKRRGTLATPVGTLNAITDTGNPIRAGSYPIQLPDFPHGIGAGYASQAKYTLSWFYLGTGNAVAGNNDRYLHTGSGSAGCVTVTDIAKWDSLYNHLILCRAVGGRNVGTIAVVD
jgi:hypothetical protein